MMQGEFVPAQAQNDRRSRDSSLRFGMTYLVRCMLIASYAVLPKKNWELCRSGKMNLVVHFVKNAQDLRIITNF